jgi:hypothetical protein
VEPGPAQSWSHPSLTSRVWSPCRSPILCPCASTITRRSHAHAHNRFDGKFKCKQPHRLTALTHEKSTFSNYSVAGVNTWRGGRRGKKVSQVAASGQGCCSHINCWPMSRLLQRNVRSASYRRRKLVKLRVMIPRVMLFFVRTPRNHDCKQAFFPQQQFSSLVAAQLCHQSRNRA